MEKKDSELYQKGNVSFNDKKSGQFIYRDFFQSLPYPEEYPAFIQIHTEYPIQSVPLHWHLGPEIVYSRNQNLSVVVEGERFTVLPGTCVLISSRALHSIEPEINKRGQDVMSIGFNGAYLEKMYPEMRKKHICYLAGVAEDKKKLNDLCEEVHQIIEKKSIDYLKLNYLLFGMLVLIYECFVSESVEKENQQDKNQEKVRDILLYVKQNFREEVTTQSVAAKFGYSREHFSRLFKRFADISFKQYLNEYRLFQAVNDLYTTDKKMMEIAIDNGFPDEKSFYSSFKKKYGLTPSEYKRQKYLNMNLGIDAGGIPELMSENKKQ